MPLTDLPGILSAISRGKPAVSEILPDGDKEKQLMQGLLNQKDGLVEATRQRELF
jgi:hypothetical protein